MIILSPLLGSLIATILMLIYGSIESSIHIKNLIDLVTIFPITFFIMSIISYLFSIPIGLILIKKNNERLWSDGFFIFLSSVSGSILGLVFSLISFNIGGGILKAVFIFTSFVLASTFNGSFYITLKKEMNKLDNNKMSMTPP